MCDVIYECALYCSSETPKKSSEKKKKMKSKSNKDDKDISKLGDNAKEVAIKSKANKILSLKFCLPYARYSYLPPFGALPV